MAVGDVYRIQQFWNVGSQLTENVLHFREKMAETVERPAQILAVAWAAALGPLYNVDLFSEDSKITVIECRRIFPTSGVPGTLVFPSAEVDQVEGGDSAERVPSQAAALTSWYTDFADRRGQGRTYWPGVSVDAQNDGQLIPAALTQLQALADGVIADVAAGAPGTGGWELCIFTRVGDAFSIVSGGVAHSNLATIRGRRAHPGVGT